MESRHIRLSGLILRQDRRDSGLMGVPKEPYRMYLKIVPSRMSNRQVPPNSCPTGLKTGAKNQLPVQS